mmetsp:Transcript_8041/g.25065  ORF Transcript_8041/g.25065 Transcript_8041/m.25065 type:complete len:397 (-) Transcript_8041:169-1359(-)
MFFRLWWRWRWRRRARGRRGLFEIVVAVAGLGVARRRGRARGPRRGRSQRQRRPRTRGRGRHRRRRDARRGGGRHRRPIDLGTRRGGERRRRGPGRGALRAHGCGCRRARGDGRRRRWYRRRGHAARGGGLRRRRGEAARVVVVEVGRVSLACRGGGGDRRSTGRVVGGNTVRWRHLSRRDDGNAQEAGGLARGRHRRELHRAIPVTRGSIPHSPEGCELRRRRRDGCRRRGRRLGVAHVPLKLVAAGRLAPAQRGDELGRNLALAGDEPRPHARLRRDDAATPLVFVLLHALQLGRRRALLLPAQPGLDAVQGGVPRHHLRFGRRGLLLCALSDTARCCRRGRRGVNDVLLAVGTDAVCCRGGRCRRRRRRGGPWRRASHRRPFRRRGTSPRASP